MNNKKQRKCSYSFGLLIGLLLIAGGLVYLLRSLGLIDEGLIDILISFPTLLLILSTYWLIRRHFFWGLIGFIVSIILLIPKISTHYPELINISYNQIALENAIIPALCIFLGIIIISKILSNKNKKRWGKDDEIIEKWKNGDGFQNLFSGKDTIFGSSKNIVLSPIFEGTIINTIFGGSVLDLRKTDIKEGETIVEVNVIFGGVEIYVPSNWEIVINTSNILGGTEDGRIYTEIKPDSTKKLLINGSCIFGGIEIKN